MVEHFQDRQFVLRMGHVTLLNTVLSVLRVSNEEKQLFLSAIKRTSLQLDRKKRWREVCRQLRSQGVADATLAAAERFFDVDSWIDALHLVPSDWRTAEFMQVSSLAKSVPHAVSYSSCSSSSSS
mgnify:CR=1 FL=1